MTDPSADMTGSRPTVVLVIAGEGDGEARRAPQAVARALDLCDAHSAALVAVYVPDEERMKQIRRAADDAFVGEAVADAIEAELQRCRAEAAEGVLGDVSRLATGRGLAVETHVAAGDPDDVVARFARDHRAVATVLGRRKRLRNRLWRWRSASRDTPAFGPAAEIVEESD